MIVKTNLFTNDTIMGSVVDTNRLNKVLGLILLFLKYGVDINAKSTACDNNVRILKDLINPIVLLDCIPLHLYISICAH